ncbi:MAG: DNA-directed RNA polymerase subunit beta' [Lachnospiraceae bacterium]|nr:DNA-directed RNA polymerase subunit beta' [Lachnospiraceae bacterium]
MPEISNTNAEPSLTYDAIKIGLASPERIREWSRGEVKKPETINYRTLKPEKDGLFCEKIFGPSKDWECHCGKYKKIRYKGVVCDRCGVEVTKASVRRERMGHIELAAPVSHIWYFKGIPSRMGLILDLSPRTLEKVLYFASYIVLDAGETDLQYKQVLSEREYQETVEKFGRGAFRVGMGAESIYELLQSIDLEKESVELKKELEGSTGQKRARIIKRLEVVEAFRTSGNKPEWMILTVVPVIPPDIRPMVQLDGGRFATSDMNDLYRRIINRNNRLKRLLDLGAPDIIVRNEKRMLQEAVDALIDNGRRGRPVTGPGNRALKSLSDMLKGKQGRFRQNLLGKRVDYSGRSVIVVGPELKIYQCGLPKEMAIELFKPFVMRDLVKQGTAHNIKAAKKMVERLQPEVWDILEDVIKEHPVMLNRAPTLHRLGIQAFEPTLVEGKAIKLHPLVCTAFNADFDGDQMAVHLPLSVEAQAECRFLLLSPNNLLKPSDGGPVAVPSQDMVLGIYYLTMGKMVDYSNDAELDASIEKIYDTKEEVIADLATVNGGKVVEGKIRTDSMIKFRVSEDRYVICTPMDLLGHYFYEKNEALLAYENKQITLHQKIRVRVTDEATGEYEIIETTMGRLIFNEIIPQDLGFVDRTKPENRFKLEVDFHVGKKGLKQILEKCINTHGATKTAETLDNIKALGYKYSTRAAMTVSISDMTVPASKKDLLDEAEKTVEKIAKDFRRGLTTEEERYKAVIETWKEADDKLTKALLGGLDKYNNIFMMADSGARGSDKQIKQLAGMRGLMADTSGRTIELPIKSNFREGLDVLEYFISAHGARKGLSDTALRTADSGYLTRRLVDVSQDLIIRETDCCAGKEAPGMWISAFMEGKEVIESLEERITGRFSCETIYDDNGEMIVKKNHMITPKRAAKIMATKAIQEAGNQAKVKIRNVLTCRSHIGVCARCYGANMATGQAVQVGEAVGIIAAQSIGEPGTQLTMRTFHTGGVAGDDITQGLPRVEELFEARKPKGLAIISEIDGVVSINDTKKKREVIVTNTETGDVKTYLIPYGSRVKVFDGDVLQAGDELTEGSVNPHDILKIKDVRAVQDYMLREVQRVYRLQGVEINDKHVEVIVRQMLKKIRIEENGDSEFLPGTMVDILEFDDEVERLEAEGKRIPTGKRVLLGITKASLATNSFLSAASFQETTKVLTEAAIKGKIDPLIGIKENVLLGKLIPAGTGMKRYRSVKLDTDEEIRLQKEAEMNALQQEETEQVVVAEDYSDIAFVSDEEDEIVLPEEDEIDFPEED